MEYESWRRPHREGPLSLAPSKGAKGGCDDKTTRAPPAQSSGARGTSPPQTLGAPVGREARASLPGGTAFGPIQAAPRQWGLRGGTSFQTTWGEFLAQHFGEVGTICGLAARPHAPKHPKSKKTRASGAHPTTKTKGPPKAMARPQCLLHPERRKGDGSSTDAPQNENRTTPLPKRAPCCRTDAPTADRSSPPSLAPKMAEPPTAWQNPDGGKSVASHASETSQSAWGIPRDLLRGDGEQDAPDSLATSPSTHPQCTRWSANE